MLPQVNKKAIVALTLLALANQPLWAEETAPDSIGEHFKTVESYRKNVEINQVKKDFLISQYELDQAKASKELFELKSKRQIELEQKGVQSSHPSAFGKGVQKSTATEPPPLPSMEAMSPNQSMSLVAVRADNETDFFAKIAIGDSSEWYEKHEMVGNWRIVTISAKKVELFDEKTKQSKTLKFK